MNYKEMRKMFRELSGRFDLVLDNYADNGVGVFMNEGRKFLDRLDETQKSWATRIAALGLNEVFVTFPYCRAIKEVWAASPTLGRWQLEKKNLQDLVDGYLLTLPAEIQSGTPLYYSPCITRTVPQTVTIESYQQWMGFVQASTSEYNGVLVNVPTDEAISLIIHGLFYSDALTADADVNYWSVNHPLLLYMSTMRQIEIINRSTQGVNDWTNSILTEMRQLGMDLVEELIAEVNEMEG